MYFKLDRLCIQVTARYADSKEALKESSISDAETIFVGVAGQEFEIVVKPSGFWSGKLGCCCKVGGKSVWSETGGRGLVSGVEIIYKGWLVSSKKLAALCLSAPGLESSHQAIQSDSNVSNAITIHILDMDRLLSTSEKGATVPPATTKSADDKKFFLKPSLDCTFGTQSVVHASRHSNHYPSLQTFKTRIETEMVADLQARMNGRSLAVPSIAPSDTRAAQDSRYAHQTEGSSSHAEDIAKPRKKARMSRDSKITATENTMVKVEAPEVISIDTIELDDLGAVVVNENEVIVLD